MDYMFRRGNRATRKRGYSALEILFVIAITGVVAAIAAPMAGNMMGNFRLSGDARSIWNAVSLAKLRASSDFTKTRVFVDLNANSFHIEIWQKTATPPAWVMEGGITSLSNPDILGFGAVTSPPPNTQAAIAQAPACLDAGNNPIGNSACVLFNSRGIPVDATNSPTTADALYVTDGTAIYGVTVSATGQNRLWRTGPTATPAWVLQ
jgi:prepilin-type N-terminal cleavage/methylation domain-containing protein